MDDLQGRLGTPGALVKKGMISECAVPAGIDAPPISLAPEITQQDSDDRLIPEILKATDEAAICFDPEEQSNALDSIYRVGAHKVIVLLQCSRGAYQSSYQIWAASDTPPYQPQLIELEGVGSEIMEASMDGMVLSSFNKGRGIADCNSSASWGWTGHQFELLKEERAPQCNGIVGGGFGLRLWTSRVNNNSK